MKRSIELASPPSPRLRWKKKEGRKYFLSLLPALAVAAFFSFAFKTSQHEPLAAPTTDFLELNLTEEVGGHEFLYESETACDYKVEIWYDNPCTACITTIGPILASSNGTIFYSMPCGTYPPCGIRLLEDGGSVVVPSSGHHDTNTAEGIYGPFTCAGVGSYEFAIYGYTQAKIYEV